jgi:uncharacterized membrane protein YeaQ/YmgE (transglycosylase-associated protein family)
MLYPSTLARTSLYEHVQRKEGSTDLSIIAWLVVGAIAGWLAGLLVPGDEGYGVIGTIIAGIVGALVGGFVLGLVTGDDWTTGINIPTIIAAVVGAVLVVVVWKSLSRRGAAA